MSAQNEMNITMTIVNAEVVAEAVNVEEMMNAVMPITIAELLEADFSNDDEAEFIQAVLEIQQDIEDVLMSDDPEAFLLPTEDDLPPAYLLLEKLEELKSFTFGDRTIARMERRLRGQNEVVRPNLTETEKANHPDYRKCPKCLRHFTQRYLGFHIDTPICRKVSAAHNLRPAGTDKIKVSDKIYNACYDLEDLYARAVDYRKNIEPELEEEEIEEDLHIVSISAEEQAENDATANTYEEVMKIEYQVHTTILADRIDDEDDYDKYENSLYEGADGKWNWDEKEDAFTAYESAIETGEFIAVRLIERLIEVSTNILRGEETIDEWYDYNDA
jgi:hypothetical protein